MAYRTGLKAAIVEEGRKQRWIAQQIGTDPATLSRWISGERDPNKTQRRALAKLLRRKISDLFPGE